MNQQPAHPHLRVMIDHEERHPYARRRKPRLISVIRIALAYLVLLLIAIGAFSGAMLAIGGPISEPIQRIHGGGK